MSKSYGIQIRADTSFKELVKFEQKVVTDAAREQPAEEQKTIEPSKWEHKRYKTGTNPTISKRPFPGHAGAAVRTGND